MMKVTLLQYTPEPEKLLACAAKLCYSPSSIDTVYDGLDNENTAKFVNMLSSIGHQSPIEHVCFTFGIEGVSRSFLAEVTRHRIASFSVQSQRYVAENNFEFVLPPEIEAIPEAKEEYIRAMQEDTEHYNALADILQKKHYETMIAEGMDEKTAKQKSQKKAIEDARFVLPNACCTKMICTFNARSLQNFFNLRCCNRAQWEIHAVADEMLRLVKAVAPNIFKNAGPSCMKGRCPEGKMTCGKMAQVQEKYRNIGG